MKNSIILSEKLNKLAKENGTYVFAIGDFYVQFAKDADQDKIYFEAVSHNYVKGINSNLVEENFLSLGFEIDDGNYYKEFLPSNIDDIVDDVQKIFSIIYKIDYAKEFEVTEIE